MDCTWWIYKRSYMVGSSHLGNLVAFEVDGG